MNFDEMTIEQIDELIERGEITENDVIKFYNNQWWRDNHEPKNDRGV